MKRKYTRRVHTETSQIKSNGVNGKSSINLPLDILKSIDATIEYRKALGLPDDKEERIARALRYQEFRSNRNG
jgi:hypothetical protein